MKGGKKKNDNNLEHLRESLGKAGLFVEMLAENVGQIRSEHGRFMLQKTKKDSIVVCGNEKISLRENNLDLLLERGEGEYVTGSLFVILK